MTELADKVVTEEEATITIADTTYPVSELSDQVKEMLSLHQEASHMAIAAKRQAAIHDLAVQSIGAMIEKAVTETEE